MLGKSNTVVTLLVAFNCSSLPEAQNAAKAWAVVLQLLHQLIAATQ